MRVIVAAAGTGGHINPGIAIANKIKEKEPDSEIIFIGTNRGIENDLVPRAGYGLKTIEAYGFKKEFSINNLKQIWQTFKSKNEVEKIIDEFKPDVVIGTGGYICVPVMRAAIAKKIPIVLHESNAYPGKALKMFAKNADLVLVGFEDTKSKLKEAKNIVASGTPTKIKKQKYSSEEKKLILEKLGIRNELPIVLIFGGSQGASAINDAMIDIVENYKNDKYQIIWATGPKQYDIVKEKFDNKNISVNRLETIKIVPYIYNMEELLNISDLVVCRSGAMTITEISIVGKPAIFIPLPSRSANRQEDNARVLQRIGAAYVILNKDLNGKVLSEQIEDIIFDDDELREMGRFANTIEIKNVEEKIYEEIKKIIK